MNDIESLRNYYDRLDRADWYYDWSDDIRVYRSGEAAFEKLKAEAATDPQKTILYDGFHAHMFSGKSWNTEKQPKPARP